MSIKSDVVEFLRTYASLTGSDIGETGELIHLEFSPIEKHKHLLSQIKFSFSKEVCEKENAELLTVTNKEYQAILSEAKETGIVAVARSYQTDRPVLMLNYLVNMKCQNHMKEDLRTIAFRLPSYDTVEPLTFWSEIDPSEAAEIDFDATLLSDKLRSTILEDIAEMKFKFEDEVERRMDRERTMMRSLYDQRRKERERAVLTLEEQIVDITAKMHNTNSMKVYKSSKKKIEGLRRKITELEMSKSKDIENINKEFKQTMKRIEENHSIETSIDLLNALMILTADPS